MTDPPTSPLTLNVLLIWCVAPVATTTLALSGGEDYELLFTAKSEEKVEALRNVSDVAVTKIGELRSSEEPIELVRRDGTIEPVTVDDGWDPFRQ